MDLPLASDRIIEEISQILQVVANAKHRAEMVDMPMNSERQEVFQVQLKGELLLAGQRLIVLAELIG